MKYYQQLDISDCGAACLAMVASKYDKYSSIAKIREIACIKLYILLYELLLSTNNYVL